MNNIYRKDGWVKTTLGPAIPGAQIWVCTQPANSSALPPSPLAFLFSDPGGLVPITQPIITDGFGHYDYYVAPGLYTEIVAFGGKVQQSYPDQSIGNVGTGSGSSIVFSTNGTPNFNQLAMDLVQGVGITIVTDNLGNTTITGAVAPTMTNTVGGLVPTPPNDATKYLNGAGTFSVPPVYNPPVFATAGKGGFLSAGVPLFTYGLVANQGMNRANNEIRVWQFENLVTRTISKVTTTGAAYVGGSANFGIYDSLGNLLLDSGPFTSNPPATTTNAISAVTLPVGVYYFAQAASDMTLQFYAFTSTSNPGAQEFVLLNANAARVGYAANALVGTSLPATLGTITAEDPTGNLDMVGVFFEP